MKWLNTMHTGVVPWQLNINFHWKSLQIHYHFIWPTHCHYEGIYLIINYYNPLYRKLYSTPYKITMFNFYPFFQVKNYIIFPHAIKYATGKA